MSKWFDANGTDVDAYPNEAFKGGVYTAKTIKKDEKCPKTSSESDKKKK